MSAVSRLAPTGASRSANASYGGKAAFVAVVSVAIYLTREGGGFVIRDSGEITSTASGGLTVTGTGDGASVVR
jgi:hypothetical protein